MEPQAPAGLPRARPGLPDVPAELPRAPAALTDGVRVVLETLWSSGHAAYLVGGGVRDSLLGRDVTDWDVATDALPARTVGLFPGGTYTNRFGTVTVPVEGVSNRVQITTFRRDHLYADHRRPDSVTFTESLDDDLARRDFTVNAIAWGRPAGDAPDARDDFDAGEARWADPTGGIAPISAQASCAPWATRRLASTRTPCVWCALLGSRRSSDSRSSPQQ
jgi:tRNA nucleotidyltransferase/poly(A) polymerase